MDVLPSKGPTFISEHTLLMRVDSLVDLPSGTIFIRKDELMLRSIQTDKIPTDKQADLHDAIAAGTVYCFWDYRKLEFDELDPHWPRNHTRRLLKAQYRVKRRQPARLVRTNPEED